MVAVMRLVAVLVVLLLAGSNLADTSASPAAASHSRRAGPGIITVATDGSAEFKTVQGAIDAVPANNKLPFTIHIKPGTYKERVRSLQKPAARCGSETSGINKREERFDQTRHS